jgi:1-acyl-sn-glycerol-3-phosphate acyltransferase
VSADTEATAGRSSSTGATARRRPRARVRPQELAAARGGAREGLDWLGRRPEATASLLYRVVTVFWRLLVFGLFRIKVEAAGRENVPKGGGYILVSAAHRGWIDPILIFHALPLEPRTWFLGSGPSAFTSKWKERLIHRLGGMLPVWRGGVGIEQHVRSAEAVLDNGAVFVQMPEGTVNGPTGHLGPFRPGAALIAMRTGAPILPFAMAGTEELYLGKRLATRVLPITTIPELVGEGWPDEMPEPNSRTELELAKRATEALERLLGPVVEELFAKTVDPPGHPRRFRKRMTWLLLGPGPLEH